ncbi:MAG: hypothetical protein M1569_02320 [Candidatus Marsarchaeota archaeon]|nr:hypothetical protein [Candidatus Marsarchaeota archaeon]MCL5413216.1 hypothetical protein [Candidatus Marsarchaeota archaeon]
MVKDKIHFGNLKENIESVSLKYKDFISSTRPVILGAILGVLTSGLVQIIFLTVTFSNGGLSYNEPVSFYVLILVIFAAIIWSAMYLYKRYIVRIPKKQTVSLTYSGERRKAYDNAFKLLKQEARLVNTKLEVDASKKDEIVCMKEDEDRDDFILKLQFVEIGIVEISYFPENDHSWSLVKRLKERK